MIRPFAPPDLDQILKIELQSFPKSPYDWATFINLHYLYPDTFLVYVLPALGRKENQIVGYIIFTREGHMISVAVHPRHRRKGIGKELLHRAMATPHLKRLWAEVRKSNRGALTFYLRLGFQVTGEVPNYYEKEDAFIIQWIPSSQQG
jgi:ribosomal protein S18 acetylase RimI-like enzyme